MYTLHAAGNLCTSNPKFQVSIGSIPVGVHCPRTSGHPSLLTIDTLATSLPAIRQYLLANMIVFAMEMLAKRTAKRT